MMKCFAAIIVCLSENVDRHIPLLEYSRFQNRFDDEMLPTLAIFIRVSQNVGMPPKSWMCRQYWCSALPLFAFMKH